MMTQTGDEQELAERFREYLLKDIEECRRLNYNPTAYRQMIEQYGAVGAVRRFLQQPIDQPSDGFVRLWELKRLDLAAEYAPAFVPHFAPLFTEDERRISRERLAEYGMSSA